MILTRIETAAGLHADKIAIQMKAGDGYQEYAYRKLIRAAASLARGLQDAGIGKGDRVAILSENRPEWMIAYLAVVSFGAVVVPLDAQMTEKEVALLLGSAEAKGIFVSDSCRRKIPPATAIMIITFDPGDGIVFSTMLKTEADTPLPPPPRASDLAALLYTSGTTGDPKGVMLTHGNLASNVKSAMALGLIDDRDNLLCLLPLHHTYPAMAAMLLPLSLGATVTILNSLKGPDILSCIQEKGVTAMLGVPQLFAGLHRAIFGEIEKKSAALRRLVKLFLGLNGFLRKTAGINIGKALFGAVHAKFGPQFRIFASGGARLDPDVQRDMTRLGFTVIEGYGLTETSPVLTFNPLSKQKAGSIGIPVPDVEVRIVNPDDQGQGELAVRGPNVMLGYAGKPQETAEVLRDGWFYTGDLGYRDRDGYYFITGRSKEMIVLSTGKKIFPEELEKYYKQIPAIQEICLMQGDRGLEAAVVPDFEYLKKTNQSHSRQVIAFGIEDLAKDLPPYKRITGLRIFKESLPVTRLGKLKRSKVRELYRRGVQETETTAGERDEELLSDPVFKKLIVCLEPFSAKKTIAADDNLELDLGLDSLSRVELIVSIEKSFGLSLPETFGSEVFTVKDVAGRIRELLASGPATDTGHVRLSWADILAQEPEETARKSVRFDFSVTGNAGRCAIKIFVTAFMKLYGRLSVRGHENLPEKGPYLIAANHASLVDAPTLVAALPWKTASQAFFLGASDWFGGPFSSRIAPFIQVIPVDMDAKLSSALQMSAYVLRRGKILCVFPEGGRSRDGSLKTFKKGIGIIAGEMNIPIVPVAIRGTYDMLPPGRTILRPRKVRVTIGKPVYPEGMDYDGIVAALRREVEHLLSA